MTAGLHGSTVMPCVNAAPNGHPGGLMSFQVPGVSAGAPAGSPGPFGVVHFELTAPASVPTIAVPPMPPAPPLPAPPLPVDPPAPPVPLPVPIGPAPADPPLEVPPPFADEPAAPVPVESPPLPELFPAVAMDPSMAVVGPESSAPPPHPTSHIARKPLAYLAYRMSRGCHGDGHHSVAFDDFWCANSGFGGAAPRPLRAHHFRVRYARSPV